MTITLRLAYMTKFIAEYVAWMKKEKIQDGNK